MSGAPRLLLETSPAAEDFRFLSGAETGVALESASARLAGGEVEFVPRSQPVLLPEGKPYLVAVFRISSEDQSLSPAQQARLAEAIARHADQHFLRAVRIDFAASAQQRTSYREFLRQLRPKLRAHQLLSVTVAPEWCREKEWIESLGADEVVAELGTGANLPEHSACHWAARIQTNRAEAPAGLRLYVHSDSPWEANAYQSLRRRIGLP